MECVGHVEIDKYAQKVLLKHWPDVPLLEDVTKVKGDEFGRVDLLCGGFPCQDLSVAGKQEGIHGKRSGLFDQIIRIAGVCRPRYIVLENVANLISRPDWFGYVLGRIAEIGFNAEWEIISAADVGAPHLRKRVWIVAYTSLQGLQGSERKGETGEEGSSRRYTPECRGEVADSSSQFKSKWDHATMGEKHNQGNRPRVSPWEVEPEVGRVADGIPSRVDRLKCLGNALVPQIAEFIGRCIMKEEGPEQTLPPTTAS